MPARAIGSSHVVIDDEVTWPQAGARLDSIVWKLSHTPHTLTRKDEVMAASIIVAYKELVHSTNHCFAYVSKQVKEHTVYDEATS